MQHYDEEVNLYVRRRPQENSDLRRYPQRSQPSPQQEEPEPQGQDDEEQQMRSPRRSHWLLWLGMGMVVMVSLWMGGKALLSWWQMHLDDSTYGRPRTYQCDAVVGHHDSPQNPSHFIALNLNRHVEIIELPGGDASAMKVYVGPVLFGEGQDLAPVTISFRDVNGDGKPDMLITIQGQETALVFINDQGQFRPQRAGEQV
jgi:hypothetical protein